MAGFVANDPLVERQVPFDTYTRPQSRTLPSDRSRRPRATTYQIAVDGPLVLDSHLVPTYYRRST